MVRGPLEGWDMKLCNNLYLEREMNGAKHIKYVSLVKDSMYKHNSTKVQGKQKQHSEVS